MRILTLNHEYPPVGGGGGTACQSIINELVSRGHEVTLLTSFYKGLSEEENSTNLRILRLKSFRKYPFRVGLLGMGAYILASTFVGLKIIRQWKPQIIHVHFAVPAGVTGFLLHIFTGIPYLLTAHLGDVPGAVPEKTNSWFRWVFPFTIPIWKNAAKIVAVSEFTSTMAKKSYPVEPVIIPNGIVLENQKTHVSLNNPAHIVFAGRFVPQKNMLAIVEILDSIKDLEWHATLIGNGPLYDQVKAKLQSLDLLERVDLPGWITSDKVSACFDKGDILLMPSLSEGLSVVGVEALAAGLAIVATNVGGFSDLVESSKNGFLSEPGDIESLKHALRNYLINPDSLLESRQASLVKSKKFDIVSVVDQYENLFSMISHK